MKLLKNITDDTAVKVLFSARETTFTIDIGLHINDAEMIQDIILNALHKKCGFTKRYISNFNENIPESFRE